MPVVIDETREADARVPEEFLRAQWTRLPGGETPPAFAQRVRQLLGVDSAPEHTAQSAATGLEPNARSPVRTATQHAASGMWDRLHCLLLVWALGPTGTTKARAMHPREAGTRRGVTRSGCCAQREVDRGAAVRGHVAEKDQEYIADGMAEEILNLLAQVPDLKVIARTSSFYFKGKNIEIADIAKKLGVAHVLEGSIRKSGDQLRMTAQLVRADSTHLWSETYDRALDDVFEVQDEIANAVVQALQIKLMGGELSRRKGGTQNLEAYQLYLRAESAHDQNTKSSLDAAGEYLDQAIKLDPSYGMAWALLAKPSR